MLNIAARQSRTPLVALAPVHTVWASQGTKLVAAIALNAAMAGSATARAHYLETWGVEWSPLPTYQPRLIEAIDERGQSLLLEIVEDVAAFDAAAFEDDEDTLVDLQPLDESRLYRSGLETIA